MNADTFWGVSYQGWHIHGHYDRDLNREVIKVQDPYGHTYPIKATSLEGAKRAVRRMAGLRRSDHQYRGVVT